MKMATRTDPAATFRAQGYVKLDAFFTPGEVSYLRSEIAATADEDASSHLDQGGLTFYENVFRRSEFVRSLLTQESVVSLLSSIIGTDFWVRWDQCVRKLAGGPEFPWHQDNAYSRVSDEYYQLWVAITAGTKDNGGLWLQPSDRRVRLRHRRSGSHLECGGGNASAVFVAAEPGDVVVFSSLLPHRTGPNRTDDERWAYVAEFMSVEQYDPLLRPPYFIAARQGRPAGEFVSGAPARWKLGTRLRYLPLQTRVMVENAFGRSV
jgi:ectoine hydroxylase-related dioxygenase (phytanoyl-CoA dioxygenase family)